METINISGERLAMVSGPIIYRLYEDSQLLYIGRSIRGAFGIVAPVKAIEKCTLMKIDPCDDSVQAKSLYRKLREKEIPKYAPMAYKRMRDENNRAIQAPPVQHGPRVSLPTIQPVPITIPKLPKGEEFTHWELNLMREWRDRGHIDDEENKRAILAMRSLTPEQKMALGGQKV